MATGMQRTLSATFAPGTKPSSRAPSRPRNSRNSSRASLQYLPHDAESMALPEGDIGTGATELLHEFVHPHHNQDEPLFGDEPPAPEDDDDDAASVEIRKQLPWYRRPSALWFLVMVPILATATAATMAPRVEIFTQLACIAYKEKYPIGDGNKPLNMLVSASMILAGELSDADKAFCAKEPVVQAAVARLNMLLTLSLGILSCMTAGWWGSISDRYGRIRVLSVAVFGVLINDVIFISTVHFHRSLPGGYSFLLLGPILDGLCGGLTALSATVHAYIADCTSHEERSRAFSLFLGLMFAGIGLGPMLGGIVVRTTGTALSVFYIAAGMHALHSMTVWFIIPESLSLRRQLVARKLKAEKDDAAKTQQGRHGPVYWLSKAFGFLSPLALFYPAVVESENTNPLKRRKRDWNLLLIAASYGTTVLLMGSYTYKFQYTSAAFGWTSEQIGYWLSAVGATRAAYLTVGLPLLIKLLKPKSKTGPIHLPNASTEDLSQSGTLEDPEDPAEPSVPATQQHHSLPFDLRVARGSIFIEWLSYIALCFASSAATFSAASIASAFGSGFGPAVQSVALGLYIERGGVESGKLFGAMSVVQSLCSQIIGPTLFGTTFMKTAGTFPKAIFFLAAGSITISFLILMLVRLPPAKASMHAAEETAVEVSHLQDETLVDPEVPLIVVEDAGWKAPSPSPSAQASHAS